MSDESGGRARAMREGGVERRLIFVLIAIGVVAVAGVLAILPYRLYTRDIRRATAEAHRLSSVVHVALSRRLVAEDYDQREITDLVNRFQGIADLEIRLRRLEAGEVHPAASSGRGSSTRNDTDLTYVAPPIVDAQGRTWLASMYFDLSPMKRRSMRLIFDLVASVVAGSLVFSSAIFLLVRHSLVRPIRRLTREIEQVAHSDLADSPPVELPHFDSSEMDQLARALEAACRR